MKFNLKYLQIIQTDLDLTQTTHLDPTQAADTDRLRPDSNVREEYNEVQLEVIMIKP